MISLYYFLVRLYYFVAKFFIGNFTRSFTSQPNNAAAILRGQIKRPEWLYYPGVEMEPIKTFTFSPVHPPSVEEFRLCERLIAAYSAATLNAPPTKTASDLWAKIIRKRYGTLAKALNDNDPKALAQALSNMFQEEFLYGISSSRLGLYPGYATLLRMRMTEEILSLAEVLAIVRAETPEQGILGYGLQEGLPKLVDDIERILKISADFPRLGGAYGFLVGNRLITPEAPEHIYVALRIKEAIGQHIRTKDSLKIVEIGAGFGGTCFWLNRLLSQSIASYTIIDMPLMNVCQGYFLTKAFGSEKVRLYGEAESSTTRFTVIPPEAKSEVLKDEFQLLINENSMPEISESVVKDYLSWAKTKLAGVFFSYNQEAFSPVNNVPQTLVPKAVLETGGYTRLSRRNSWLRRGYIEEVYACNQ